MVALNSIDIFPWDDNFNTGLPQVDEQHQKLVQLLNKLASHVAFRTELKTLTEVFDELAAYAVYHFETEEAIWQAHLANDPDESAHRKIHGDFIATVERLRTAQNSRPLDEIAEEALGFLARWLASHILESDRHMAYVVFGVQAGLPLADAKRRAAEQMSGATRVLIDIILSIYASLSANTLHLMRELAERKRNEEALIKARLQAEAANITKSRFLATMSHEIRTPMNGILGMGQLLRDPGLSASERQEYVETIMESGQTLLALLNNILDLSAAEAGQLALTESRFDPAALIDKVCAQFAEAAQNKHLVLSAETDATLAATGTHSLGDSQRIEQMLAHLLSNALKFTAQGEIRITVSALPAAQDMQWLEFSVSDTGIGVMPEVHAHLFQPFSQGDSSTTRPYDGVGLGLSIVHSYAQLMGGEVGVDSADGQGARFWFRIPCRPAP